MTISFNSGTAFVSLILAMMLGTVACARPAEPWNTLPTERRLPEIQSQGYVEREGARIWYGSVGSGTPVILLHGGMSSSRNWGNQVPELIRTNHQVILVDSRGHGRSTLGSTALSYELMADDVLAVIDALGLDRTAVVGWSDGAIIGLVLAMHHPDRLTKVYAFGANMDQAAVKPGAANAPILGRVVGRLAKDYAELSPAPDGFGALHQAVEAMQKTQPDYSAAQLAAIHGPEVLIADGAHDEFIRPEHPGYLARTIPGAKLEIFPAVSHFAPWQDPVAFNRSMRGFLDGRP